MKIVKHENVRPDRVKRTLNIREFHNKRNKILITRGSGGLGDILMHRMMFEDIKLLMPDAEIHFACPVAYKGAVIDHPFLDKVLGLEESNRHDYLVSYNTTTACCRYEMKVAPASGKHRSDIWANHCGFELTKHDMHFRLTDEEKQVGKDLLEQQRKYPGPIVLISPISSMYRKNLLSHHIDGVVKGILERGCCPVGLHTTPLEGLATINNVNMRQWLGVINQADYIISVDTAQLHCAGGMNKPFIGVFTFVHGETYSMYYKTIELIQGPCPFSYNGCYNFGACPDRKPNDWIPCHQNLNYQSILDAFDRLLAKNDSNI